MADNLIIKELKVKFISSKVDNYDNMISYFKIVDKEAKKKLKLVNKLSDTLYKPFWTTDEKEMMLKVKTKHIKRKDLIKNNEYVCDTDLVPYYVEKTANELKGYYAKVKLCLDVAQFGHATSEEEESN
jgi:hypothetical protein